MTNEELIARLVDWSEHDEGKINDARQEAADRIEALTAENAKLHDHIEGVAKDSHKIMLGYEAKLAKVVEGLHTISGHVVLNNENEEELSDSALLALALLAEIEGESHE